MVCPTCKYKNRFDATYCASCGEPLGSALTIEDDTVRAKRVTQKTYVKRNCFLATLLAVFPGIGQLYNSDYKKMAVVWLTSSLGFFLAWTFVVPIIAFGVYAWSILDAYSVAKGRSSLW